MAQQLELARQLDAQARDARTLAEAQALAARADYLRRTHRPGNWSLLPLFRLGL